MRFLLPILLASSPVLMADEVTDMREAVVYCSRELFTAFYPPPFVAKTLQAFGLSETTSQAIVRELQARESDIVGLVEESADTMVPNPLYEANQQKKVVALFDQVVYNVFRDVLVKNGVGSDDLIRQMMQDVHRQKAARFKECMELKH